MPKLSDSMELQECIVVHNFALPDDNGGIIFHNM